MTNKSLNEIEDEVLKLCDDGVDVEEIVTLTKTPRYLIESILKRQRDVYFR